MDIKLIGYSVHDLSHHEINVETDIKKENLKDHFIANAIRSARICYSPSDWQDINPIPNMQLLQRIVENGHHSVFGHSHVNLYLRDFPKIFAMMLNNQAVYTTSEKSARYTIMEIEGIRSKLYDKWLQIFQEQISLHYPEEKFPRMDKTKVKKLAQENARYLTSVFTPTKFEYTVDFRQLNYIMNWFDQFIKHMPDSAMNRVLKESMKEFNKQMEFLRINETQRYHDKTGEHLLFRNLKLKDQKRNLPEFYTKIESDSDILNPLSQFNDEFGRNYFITYYASLAYLAQAHRHRTLNYLLGEINDSDIPNLKPFIPKILIDPKIIEEWKKDFKSVTKEGDIPQGSLVQIQESGGYDEFIMKAQERLCGNAQLEIMEKTKEILGLYLKATQETHPEIFNELKRRLVKKKSESEFKPKCASLEIKCQEGCALGPGMALTRLV